MGTPANVQIGPGLLYVAAIGTTEPTSASASLPSANWFEVGYTEDGSTFSWETSQEGIEVEEELEPIRWETTGRNGKVAFAMAESTRRNLALALNAGAGAANSAAGIGPPAIGQEVSVQMFWRNDQTADANKAAIVFRRVRQGGTIELNRQKAPDKSLIAVEFNIEKPQTAVSPAPPGSTGSEPFWLFPNSSGLI